MRSTIKIIFGVAALIITSFAHADNCGGLQGQVRYADNKLRQGGNSSYMNMWRKSRNSAEKRLSQCRKSYGTGEPQIRVYKGEAGGSQNHYESHISSNLNNHQVQSLIKTCNYWIDQVNKNSSPENQSFRDNACRDARVAENRILNPQETFLMVRNRTLKECIKPNKVIDNEVKECMEGFREPTWANK